MKRFLYLVVLGCASLGFGQQTSHVVSPADGLDEADYAGSFDTNGVFPQINEESSEYRTQVDIERRTRQRYVSPIGPPNNLKPDFIQELDPPRTEGERETMKFGGILKTSFDPADPELAVGPKHVVQVVNSKVAFFDRFTGKKVFELDLGIIPSATKGLFEDFVAEGSLIFDPRTCYDPIAKRFYATVMEKNDAKKIWRIHLAVSDDSDPTGTWHFFRFSHSFVFDKKDTWADYNTLGYNKDAIALPYLAFQVGANAKFYGSRIFVIKKSTVLKAGTPTFKAFNMPNLYTIQAARTNDASLDRLYGVGAPSNTSMRVFCWRNLTTTPTMDYTDMAIPEVSFDYNFMPTTRESRTMSIHDRFLSMAFRGGTFVTVRNTLEEATNATNKRYGIRWYEVNPNSWPGGGLSQPKLVQNGVLKATVGKHYFMPAINKNADGDIGLTCTYSSKDVTATTVFAGRKKSLTLGKLNVPTITYVSPAVKYGASTGAQRWGDYIGIEIDPVDNLTFMSTNMYARNPDFGWNTTIIGNEVRGINTVPMTPTYAGLSVGTSATGTVANVLTAGDNKFFTVKSKLNGSHHLAASDILCTGVAFNKARLQSLKIEVRANVTQVGDQCFVYIYNYRLVQYQKVGIFKPTATGGTTAVLYVNGPWSDYISGSSCYVNVDYFFTKPFDLKVDYVKVTAVEHKA